MMRYGDFLLENYMGVVYLHYEWNVPVMHILIETNPHHSAYK